MPFDQRPRISDKPMLQSSEEVVVLGGEWGRRRLWCGCSMHMVRQLAGLDQSNKRPNWSAEDGSSCRRPRFDIQRHGAIHQLSVSDV
jgi:hypothetical protein